MDAELTGRQKRFLRGLGQTLRPAASVGKEGLSDGVVGNVKALLAAMELVKVRIPAGDGKGRQQMGQDLAAATGSTCLAVIGRTVLLYRANMDLPPNKRAPLE